jgi:hypothetical protein
VIIDLLDYQVGSVCEMCSGDGSHALAEMRTMDGVPVCEDCAVAALEVERALRDLMRSQGLSSGEGRP